MTVNNQSLKGKPMDIINKIDAKKLMLFSSAIIHIENCTQASPMPESLVYMIATLSINYRQDSV